MTDHALQILRADAGRQVAALRILFSRFPVDEQEARLQDALLSVQRGALNLAGLWLAERHGRPVGATLVMSQPDGVSLVWPPVITESEDSESIPHALMAVVCRELEQPAVKFGQSLLSPDEVNEAGLLSEYGFEIGAELYFLARSLGEPWPRAELPGNVSAEEFDERRNLARFETLIEQTYVDSLDCPLLNGQRTGTEAIAGHRLSGVFHPRGWRLYRADGRDAAVLLLNEHPDQDAVELVYFGVAPEFRGEGFGRRLIGDALALAQSWNRAVMFLAVDAGNNFANGLYAEFSFQEVARRVAWLRFPQISARK